MRSFRPRRISGVAAPEPPFLLAERVEPSLPVRAPAPVEQLPAPPPMDCTPMLTGLLRGRSVDPGVVAVISHDDELRERLRGDLEADGYRVLAAASGPALIPGLVGSTPALVLMDDRVIDPEPYELCSTVRDDPTLSGLTVVLMTRRCSIDARRVAFHAGADEILQVPYLRSELRGRVGLRLQLLRLQQAAEPVRSLAAG